MTDSSNNILPVQEVNPEDATRTQLRLPRILTPLETWGFGLSGLLLWLGTAPGMHAALGEKAIFVWLPATIVGILLNLQVKRLGTTWQDMSGGTPNYAARLLSKYPGLARYGAIGYLLGWVSVPPMNAIIVTDLIKANLAQTGIHCPENLLKIIFTAVPYIVAFSGTRALGILHLFFVLPAIGFLTVFCVQGLGWLTISPVSPGFFPTTVTSISFTEWAKWFFVAVYAAYGCETASSFVADSRRPPATLRGLTFAAWLLPVVYIGGSWLLMRLANAPNLGDNAFLNLLAAAKPYWGQSASLLVTFLIVSGALLSSATAVSNSPRILYQLSLDKLLSPVFSFVSRQGVLQPALIFCLLMSLICLLWGDVARIVMVTGTGYLTSMMAIHLGLWLRRDRPEVLCGWLSGGFFLLEAVVLVVGGLAWSWIDWLIGLLLPILILLVDASLHHIAFPPFRIAWWLHRRERRRDAKSNEFVALQVGILLVLVCSATAITWALKGQLNRNSVTEDVSANLFVVLLMAIAYIDVAIACWTSLPQVVAISEAREQAENLFITALETVLDTILVVNEKGAIRQANPAAEKLFGMNTNALVGHPLKEFLANLADGPHTWSARSEQILKQTATNSAQSIRIIEATVSAKKNQNLQEYIVILRDITERKRSEAAIQEANAYLTAIIDNLADGLLVTDMIGRVTRINPALLTMFSFSKDDAMGQNCQTIFSNEIAELVAQTRRQPEQIFTAEVALENNCAGKAVATAIVKDEEKSACIGSVILIRDITSEKEVDRMKTDFISTVSHELRTPLTSVLGFAKLIKKKLEDTIFTLIQTEDKKAQRAIKQVGDNINIIVSEGERLTSLINDVLDIAKMEAGKVEWQMQPVSISEIIEHAIAATFSLSDAKGLAVEKEIESDLPEVTGDRDRLIQVLINLISNAIKFTDVGTVTCQAKLHSNSVIVSISDTGMGITPEDIEKVFEKFKQVGDTLTDKPKGTGLGLPICKQIIEHHNGRIWVESEPDRGSTFSFSVPINKTSYVETEKLNIDTLVRHLKQSFVETAPFESPDNKTILVVDDDTHIRELLRQQLETEGYQVREAKDGIDAISQINKEKPDLIVLDVMMPQMSGFDLAAVLKSKPQTMEIPIIILSIVEDKQRGYQLGIDRYFTKPINLEKLLPEIQLLLSQGRSKKKVLVVDKDTSIVRILSDVLQAKGYNVVEASSGQECIEKAIALKPDLIIVDSVFSQEHNLVKTLRFDNGLENVLFVLLADNGTEAI